MKSKNTLLSIILCATFCACAIFIGVWALVYSQNSITSSGQFTFYGIGVNADVTGKIYGFADSTNPAFQPQQLRLVTSH